VKRRCVLMFSGGRDSTLAALQLHASGFELDLATITSGHLIGIDRVRRRLRELRGHLSQSTRWLSVAQPMNPVEMPMGFSERTCLPCQQAYVLAGFKLLKDEGLKDLALGYAEYQSSWPEQAPEATRRLASLLKAREVDLHLPVYGIRTKELALRKLADANLSTEALEQKCLKQITNVTLEQDQLVRQLDLWEALLCQSLDRITDVRMIRLHALTLAEA
jgi:hypothetical protein